MQRAIGCLIGLSNLIVCRLLLRKMDSMKRFSRDPFLVLPGFNCISLCSYDFSHVGSVRGHFFGEPSGRNKRLLQQQRVAIVIILKGELILQTSTLTMGSKSEVAA